jgi:hypothetical protein
MSSTVLAGCLVLILAERRLVREDGHRLRGVQGDAGPTDGLGTARWSLGTNKPTLGPTLNDARIAPTLHFA